MFPTMLLKGMTVSSRRVSSVSLALGAIHVVDRIDLHVALFARFRKKHTM
jgi:hypothetical protein